jgi:hypothetical protein
MKWIVIALTFFSFSSQAKVMQSVHVGVGTYIPTLTGLNETTNTEYEIDYTSAIEYSLQYKISLLSWLDFVAIGQYRFIEYDYMNGASAEKYTNSTEYTGRLEIYGGLTAKLFVGLVFRDDFYFAEPSGVLSLQSETMSFVRGGIEQILAGKRQGSHFGFLIYGDTPSDGEVITERSGYGLEFFIRFPSAKDSLDIHVGGEQFTKKAEGLTFTERNTKASIQYSFKF